MKESPTKTTKESPEQKPKEGLEERMKEERSKDTLLDSPFSHKERKDGRVFVSWYGKQVAVLRGKECAEFLAKVRNGTSEEQQLAMAKITGNFKRGNERRGVAR